MRSTVARTRRRGWAQSTIGVVNTNTRHNRRCTRRRAAPRSCRRAARVSANTLASQRGSLLFTPAIQLETLFILNGSGCIVSTREQNPSPGPRFSLIRGRIACAWAVHEEVPKDVDRQIDLLA